MYGGSQLLIILSITCLHVRTRVHSIRGKMSKRRSPIWLYFTACGNDRQATCKVCCAKVSRGGQLVKTFTTTNLVGHLRKHPAEYKMYEDEKNTTEQLSHEFKSEAPLKQLTLEESSS